MAPREQIRVIASTIKKTEVNVTGSVTLTKGITRRLMTKLATPPTTKSTAATSTIPICNRETFPMFLPLNFRIVMVSLNLR